MSPPAIQIVSPASVRMDARFQPRTSDGALFNPAEVDRMQADGVSRGHETGWAPEIYDPIHVWTDGDGAIYVLEGFHRLALAQRTGVTEINAIVHVGISEADAIRLAGRSNLKTRPMDAIEEAAIYRRARDEGATWDEIARRYARRPASYYERRAAIAYLTAGLQDDVRRKLLPIDYAEAIGEVARAGASPGLQQTLARIAVQTKARVDLFRRLAESCLRRQKGEIPETVETGLLFDLGEITDKGAEAVTRIFAEAAEAAQVRDGWDAIRRAIDAQTRRLVKRGRQVPEDLARLIAGVDAFRADADRDVGSILGEGTEVGNAVPGTRAVREARPFLKWVGSKTREAPVLIPLIRDRLAEGGTYYEPFLGSGAVFFALGPDRAVLGDAIRDLVDTFLSVRDDPCGVAIGLSGLVDRGLDEETFKRIRAWAPQDRIAVAARFLYLNRTSFNGLYRTNRDGKYNVPWGHYANPRIPTAPDLQRCSDVLQVADVLSADWKAIVAPAVAGDCIFCDPPYPGTFTGYAGNETDSIVKDMGFILRAKADAGVGIVITVPDTPMIRPIFDGWCDPVPVPRTTTVSAKSGGRGALNQIAWVSRR